MVDMLAAPYIQASGIAMYLQTPRDSRARSSMSIKRPSGYRTTVASPGVNSEQLQDYFLRKTRSRLQEIMEDARPLSKVPP